MSKNDEIGELILGIFYLIIFVAIIFSIWFMFGWFGNVIFGHMTSSEYASVFPNEVQNFFVDIYSKFENIYRRVAS